MTNNFSVFRTSIEAPERYRRRLRAQFTNSFFDEEVDGSHFLACGALSGQIYWKWRSPKCGEIFCRLQKGMEVVIVVLPVDRHKLCRSPSHTLSIDETQCFACKNHSVVVLIVVIAIVFVVDFVYSLFWYTTDSLT